MQDIETSSHSANHTKEWKRQNKKKLHTRLTNSQIDLGKNKAETLLQLKHENVCVPQNAKSYTANIAQWPIFKAYLNFNANTK